MLYLTEDGTVTRTAPRYDNEQYGCRPYMPQHDHEAEYHRGYDAGKIAVGVGTVVLGTALTYFILKKLNEN